MLQRAKAKESEGSGPYWSLKEGRVDDLNVRTSKANSGPDAKDPMHRSAASGSKGCRSMFSYIAFRTYGNISQETRARDGRSGRGRYCVTLPHICEGIELIWAYEGVCSIDTESDRVSDIDGVRLSEMGAVNGGVTGCVSGWPSANCRRFGSLADERR
jgi:hypothetical protein